MLRVIIAAYLLLTCTPGILRADLPLGIWSWNQNAFSTENARKSLVAFCREQGITKVDQHVSLHQAGSRYELRNTDALAKLVTEANRMGISIAALRGERKMFFAENHASVLKQLSAIIAFNKALPKGTSLSGIKYDVEPYLTDEWKAGGETREIVMRDYLDCLSKIRELLTQKSAKLELTVDVPFWWDKEEFTLEFGDSRTQFVHHIQNHVDAIGIMSYRRSAPDVIRLSKQEITYANNLKQEQSVSVGLNFNRAVGAESVTTFHGMPASTYRVTLSSLQQSLKANKSVRYIMLHDYKNFAAFLNPKTN